MFNTRKDQGMTLIELLITVAVIVIVFAIAVPVVLNITASVQTDADSVSTAALNDFKAQYGDALGATLTVSNDGYTYAVMNGRTLARIHGDATSGTPAAPPLQGSRSNNYYDPAWFAYFSFTQAVGSPNWSNAKPVLVVDYLAGTFSFMSVTAATQEFRVTYPAQGFSASYSAMGGTILLTKANTSRYLYAALDGDPTVDKGWAIVGPLSL